MCRRTYKGEHECFKIGNFDMKPGCLELDRDKGDKEIKISESSASENIEDIVEITALNLDHRCGMNFSLAL